MTCFIINGSPRGVKSNSRAIISWMLEGGLSEIKGSNEVIDLAESGGQSEALKGFLLADTILVVFPLYTDNIPGIMAEFIENIYNVPRKQLASKRISFVLHSGFVESRHSYHVASWLKWICIALGMECFGVAVKGGSEGFRFGSAGEQTRERFVALGRNLANGEKFDPCILEDLAKPHRLSFLVKLIITVLTPTSLLDSYWNTLLKRNGAWENRHARQYESK